MQRKRATNLTDYQKRVHEFSVGDRVAPFGYSTTLMGVVLDVHLGIGMVDVQFPNGSIRYPVEDLQLLDADGRVKVPEIENNSVPGGVSLTLPLSKKALYWKERDRRYHATKSECGSDCFHCPRCRSDEGEPIKLKKAIYKRREGASEHLLGCPSCLFLIKKEDILRHNGGV